MAWLREQLRNGLIAVAWMYSAAGVSAGNEITSFTHDDDLRCRAEVTVMFRGTW